MSYEDKARELGVPLIPAREAPPRADSVVAVCGVCGRSIHRVESYYCGNAACPLLPKVTL